MKTFIMALIVIGLLVVIFTFHPYFRYEVVIANDYPFTYDRLTGEFETVLNLSGSE